MDIKPFNEQMPGFWPSVNTEPILTTLLIIAAIGIIVSFALLFLDVKYVSLLVLVVSVLLGTFSSAGHAIIARSNITEHYKNSVSKLMDSLHADGFTLVSGTPDLHPNTQSSLLLSYGAKQFECTMLSPIDTNTNVVFSCGEKKLTLEEVKAKS